MAGHHLILGELSDFLTGETLEDTLDERYRQNLSRLLVHEKGYRKEEVTPRCDLMVQAGDKRAVIKVDFQITLNGKVCMIIKYGPGSIVTRHRPAIAASRLLRPYQIPVIVVTNGEDADILDGRSASVIGKGIAAMPCKSDLLKMFHTFGFELISPKRAGLESRIIYAYEVDGSCPCDDTICRL